MLVQHHIKYEEIHGVDEVVMMTPSDHKKLHNRLRREGQCTVPPSELYKISTAAHRRTEKCKQAMQQYYENEENGPRIRRMVDEYRRKNVEEMAFFERLDVGIYLKEHYRYNNATGNVWVSTGFHHTRRDIVFINI